MNLPAITIRNTHERPEGMDVGTLIMTGLKKEHVLDAVRVIITQHGKAERVMSMVKDYEAGGRIQASTTSRYELCGIRESHGLVVNQADETFV